jgi:hypothetical protein
MKRARRPSRNGVALFLVIGMMVCGAILVFALSLSRSGSVELLSQTADQGRLQLIAQSSNNETVALFKRGANRPDSALGRMFRAVFAEKKQLGPGERWEKPFSLSQGDLPVTSGMIQMNLNRSIGFEVEGKIVMTGQGKTVVPAYFGYMEIISRAFHAGSPKKGVHVKERREIRLANLGDFFDKYALFVKRYYPWYNDPNRRIILEGIPSRKTYSWAYLGSSFYPPCPEFPGVKSVKVGETPPPILLDVDFDHDEVLLKQSRSSKTGFASLELGANATKSDGGLFFVSEPISCKSLFDKGFCAKDELYRNPQLQEFYKTRIVNVAEKDPSSKNDSTVSSEIVKDFQACGGNLAQSKMFQAVVQTCIDHWQYCYGYTDYNHVFSEKGQISDFVKTHPFSGVLGYFNEYAENRFNLNRVRGGKMPLLFGRDNRTPVLVEGAVFARYFKVAFFDAFTAQIPLQGGAMPIQMPAFACRFVRPDKPQNFMSREGQEFARSENVLMSRAGATTMNRFYFMNDTKNRHHPEQRGGIAIAADEIFPGLDYQLVSHMYPSGKDFLKDRLMSLEDGRQVLDIDGQMVISAGGLDLRGISVFRGRGHIIVLQGHCWLGSFMRADPASNDSVKFYLQNGSFCIMGNQDKEVIEASLVSLSLKPSNDSGLLVANKKTVEIYGNLIVDAIAAEDAEGLGKELVIRHDPRIFRPADPVRVSIGKNRILYSVYGGEH